MAVTTVLFMGIRIGLITYRLIERAPQDRSDDISRLSYWQIDRTENADLPLSHRGVHDPWRNEVRPYSSFAKGSQIVRKKPLTPHFDAL